MFGFQFLYFYHSEPGDYVQDMREGELEVGLDYLYYFHHKGFSLHINTHQGGCWMLFLIIISDEELD